MNYTSEIESIQNEAEVCLRDLKIVSSKDKYFKLPSKLYIIGIKGKVNMPLIDGQCN